MNRISRRRFLIDSARALGLGGVALVSGCSDSERVLGLLGRAGLRRADDYTAEFVGQSHARGHRLRDLVDIPASAETRSTAVVIVGAGIAGIAAARALSRAGVEDYRILELEDEAGGNSRGGTIMGIDCPWGAHYLPAPGPAAEEVAALLSELRLRHVAGGKANYDERHLCHSPQERLFIDGRWQEGVVPHAGQSAATLEEYRRFADLVSRFRASNQFVIPTAARRWNDTMAQLDTQTFAQWLRERGFKSPPLQWYLDYCCRDDYGAGSHRVSAWAGLQYFASRNGFRCPGDCAHPDDEPEPMLTWPEGNAWLARRLAAPHAERIHTGALVLRVEQQRHQVVLHTLDCASGRVTRWQAQRAVLATPLFVSARLLAAPPDALLEASSRLTYAPWLVANLYVDRPLALRSGQAPLSWDNVIYASPGLGYVNALHQSTLPFQAATVLTYYLSLGDDPAAGRRLLMERDLAAWCEMILEDLAVAHPDLRRKVRHIGIMRYGHGMAVPTPGTRGAPWLARLRAPLGRVHLAHSDLSGYSIFEEAFHWGLRAGAAAASVLRSARG